MSRENRGSHTKSTAGSRKRSRKRRIMLHVGGFLYVCLRMKKGRRCVNRRENNFCRKNLRASQKVGKLIHE